MILQPRLIKTVAIAVAVVLVGGFVLAAADQSRGPDAPGFLSDLPNEVRLLRQAIEKSTQINSQVQAISIYLSAQQNRLNQETARGDELRRELSDVMRQMRNLSEFKSTLERRIASGTQEERNKGTENLQEIKTELAQLTSQQIDLSTRVADLDATIQADLVRWTEMITRLEQLTRQ